MTDPIVVIDSDSEPDARSPKRLKTSLDNAHSIPSPTSSIPEKTDRPLRQDTQVRHDFPRGEACQSSQQPLPPQENEHPSVQGTNKLTSEDSRFQLRHEVALPEGFMDYIPLDQHENPVNPARVYPFTLDPFQQASINAIDRGESVLVSAHTSAGKTAVAEYAIAQSLKSKQRVVYTSPIKALSNQKFRELSTEFGDVGLMTGDISISLNASCLVMTTEVLRSMLYRGSEVMREVSWVIFDEIHYMRDADRGVVWEETIILLPKTVRFVFLSATIPNARQFADWICRLHQQPCHVVYTDFRPTPLQHYIYPENGEGIHLVIDERGKFREDNYSKAMAVLSHLDHQKMGLKRKMPNADDGLQKVIRMIMVNKFDPVIAFAFGRRDVEFLAMNMSKFDFTDEGEKEMIDQVFQNAVSGLPEFERNIPQIQQILPLLRLGIGIHHGGLLPLLKEIIEILFQESLLKILFATETFAMGLNMPARTVVFTGFTKFDGRQQRSINSGEYIQMSGRAGRRGIDDRGIVISKFNAQRPLEEAKMIMHGEPNPLNSAFKLNATMILNMLRVDGMRPEYILERSFYQFQNDACSPKWKGKLQEYQSKRVPEVRHEEQVVRYTETLRQLNRLAKDARDVIQQPSFTLQYLQPGRLVWLRIEGGPDFGWSVVLRWSYAADKRRQTPGFRVNRVLGAGSPKKDDDRSLTLFKDDPEVTQMFARINELEVNTSSLDVSKDEDDSGSTAAKIQSSSGKQGRKDEIMVDVLVPVPSWWMQTEAALPGRSGPLEFFEYLNNYGPDLVSPPSPTVGPVRTLSRHFSSQKMMIKTCCLKAIHRISAIKIQLPSDLKNGAKQAQVNQTLLEIIRKFEGKIPVVDPVGAMGIKDPKFHELCRKIRSLESAMMDIPIIKSVDIGEMSMTELEEMMLSHAQKKLLAEQIQMLTLRYAKSKHVLRLDELKARKRVLRRLGYTNSQDIIEQKGRTACCFNAGDSLLLTEILYDGLLLDLEPAELAAVMSMVANVDKSNQSYSYPTRIKERATAIRAIARKIGHISQQCGLPVDPTEYADGLSDAIVHTVYEWCKGRSFPEVMKKTDMFEGSVIRCMRSLDELLLQTVEGCRSMGNDELAQKCEQARQGLRREQDIIFCASLYL